MQAIFEIMHTYNCYHEHVFSKKILLHRVHDGNGDGCNLNIEEEAPLFHGTFNLVDNLFVEKSGIKLNNSDISNFLWKNMVQSLMMMLKSSQKFVT